MAIPADWFKHLPEGEQDKFKEQIRSSHRVLSRLKDIIEARLVELEVKETSLAEYENPSWALKQAHHNGRRAEALHLKKLLTFLEE